MVNQCCNVFEEFKASSWDHLRQQSSHVNFVTNVKYVHYKDRTLPTSFEFSRNVQSWQFWEFCTTSNENKLELVIIGINFNVNLKL